MIQYSLICKEGHQFDSWFQSASAYETLKAGGHLVCSVCGCADVSKAVMAPRLSIGTTADDQPQQPAPPAQPDADAAVPLLREPTSDVEKAISELRRKVEESSDYVGDKFTEQARAMHLGEAPERSIFGEARPEDAKALVEEGVPVMPLPFRPKKKSN